MNRNPTALILNWGKGPILDYVSGSLEIIGYNVIRHIRPPEAEGEVIETIIKHRPVLFVTLQRLYKKLSGIRNVLTETNSQSMYLDLGVWPHYDTYILDSQGENAASSIVGQLSALENNQYARLRADRCAHRLTAMKLSLRSSARAAAANLSALGIDNLPSFSLAILQREKDQVLIHDAPAKWRNPGRFAEKLIREAGRSKQFIVIKAHPMSKAVEHLPMKGRYHRIVPKFRRSPKNDQQLAWLLAHCNRAVMVNSTVHYQSLALGRPTVCLGRGWFSENNVVVEAEGLDNFFSVKSSPDGDRYLSHMLSRQMKVKQFADPSALSDLMHLVLDS